MKPYDFVDNQTVVIYCDGSISKADVGGIGLRAIYLEPSGEEAIKDSYSFPHINVSSGQIEIIACVKALEEVQSLQQFISMRKVIVVTDSK